MRIIGRRRVRRQAYEDASARILRELRRDGISVSSFGELIADDDAWLRLRDDIADFARTIHDPSGPDDAPTSKDDYVVRRFRRPKGSGAHTFAGNDPWIRFGTNDSLLSAIEAYTSTSMRLVDLDNRVTVPYPNAVGRVGSQQWHRDPWDDHIVKVFVYFTDVDEHACAFEYIRDSASGGRYGERWPWAPGGVYPPQNELESVVRPEDRLVVDGKSGTVIVCDTSGFHRGGFARSRRRVLSYHAYVSRGSQKKREFAVDWSAGAEDLSTRARQALK